MYSQETKKKGNIYKNGSLKMIVLIGSLNERKMLVELVRIMYGKISFWWTWSLFNKLGAKRFLRLTKIS